LKEFVVLRNSFLAIRRRPLAAPCRISIRLCQRHSRSQRTIEPNFRHPVRRAPFRIQPDQYLRPVFSIQHQYSRRAGWDFCLAPTRRSV
jgi:hypothetical protein